MAPTIFSRIIDKARHPGFSFHRHSTQDTNAASRSHSFPVTPRGSMPTQTLTDEEETPVGPTETFSKTRPGRKPSISSAPMSTGTIQAKDEPIALPQSPPHTPTSPGTYLQVHDTPSEPGSTSGTDKASDKPLQLTNFRILRTVGTGSFGRVHLVQSKYNERHYAIKVLKKTELVRLKQVEHTNSERATLIGLKCPFIVNLWGTFQDNVNLYMVMDYVPGGELFSLMRRSKRLTVDAARFYAAEVLSSLSYLHSRDIIYRDLKPENLLLDAHGHIKVTDFGFAKHVPDNITWTLCGTPDYLAPEVIQSKGYGKAVDYWALGILIFEMLAGFPPFYDSNQFKQYEKILSTEVKFPSHFDKDAKDLLKHLLTVDLTQRYGNLKGGVHDVMEHAWFRPIDFDLLSQRRIKAPFIPTVKGDGDASNFEKYAEDSQPYGHSEPDPYKDLFKDF